MASLLVGTLTGCTSRLYQGERRPSELVGQIHVGSTIVREIDGQRRRGGTFDVSHFEVEPGVHHLTLIFELPARTFGPMALPSQWGIGTCELVFTAAAGKHYYLGAQALGEPMSRRWNGHWEAWVRDPTVSEEDDIIARCQASEAPGAPATGSPAAAAASPGARPVPRLPPSVAAAPVAPAQPAPPVSPPPVVVAPAATPPAPAAAEPPQPQVQPPPQIAVGSWNLRSFGKREKDLASIAKIIDANFDVIAILEVTDNGGEEAYMRLLVALGSRWAGLLSSAPRSGDAHEEPAERYAIFYRKDRVRPCPDWPVLRHLGTAGQFLHDPVTGCFEAGDQPNHGLDFLLTAYHARWANGDAGDVAQEVAQLDQLIAAMRQARPGERDLLIAGDFNLEAAELTDLTQATNVTIGNGSVLDLRGELSPRRPDHILAADANALTERQGGASILDVRSVARAPSSVTYYRTISDHLPLQLILRSTGPDDD